MTVLRWNGHALHQITGVARAAATHSQPSKWSGITIDSTARGTVSTAATVKRRRKSAMRAASEAM